MQDDDRRVTRRISFHREATLHLDDQVSPVTIENLSLKGVLFSVDELGHPLVPGQTARLRMQLGAEQALEMVIEVVSRRDDSFGARWIEIDLEDMTHLRNLVSLNLGDASIVDEELSRLISD